MYPANLFNLIGSTGYFWLYFDYFDRVIDIYQQSFCYLIAHFLQNQRVLIDLSNMFGILSSGLVVDDADALILEYQAIRNDGLVMCHKDSSFIHYLQPRLIVFPELSVSNNFFKQRLQSLAFLQFKQTAAD